MITNVALVGLLGTGCSRSLTTGSAPLVCAHRRRFILTPVAAEAIRERQSTWRGAHLNERWIRALIGLLASVLALTTLAKMPSSGPSDTAEARRCRLTFAPRRVVGAGGTDGAVSARTFRPCESG